MKTNTAPETALTTARSSCTGSPLVPRPDHRLPACGAFFATALLLAAPSVPLSAQPPPNAAADHIKNAWRDRDDNGWNDAWELCFPGIRHRDQATDTDGDGATDYQEMLSGTMPFNKIISKTVSRAPEEQRAFEAAELRRQAQEEQRMLAQAAYWKRFEGTEVGVDAGNGKGMTMAEAHENRLRAYRDKVLRKRPLRAAAYLQLKNRLRAQGVPEVFKTKDGRSIHLSGESGGEPVYYTTFNTVAAQTISTNRLNLPAGSGGLGLNLTGAGVSMGHWDGATILPAHSEFAPLTGGGPARFLKMDTDSSAVTLDDKRHATHTAGTMFAKGADSSAAGMAPGGFLRTWNYELDISEFADTYLTTTTEDDIMVSNHSYGSTCGWGGIAADGAPIWFGTPGASQDFKFSNYLPVCYDIDDFVEETLYPVMVFAAGNDRYEDLSLLAYAGGKFHILPNTGGLVTSTYNTMLQQWEDYLPPDADGLHYPGSIHNGYLTLPPQACCYNVLTVGSVADVPGGYTGGAVVPSSFSSTGPTYNGEIKPDVAANGESVYSAWITSGGAQDYSAQSGTSMAAPAVAGSIALLIEHYRSFYGSGARLWASTVKGLIVHTADDVDSDGDSQGNDGPDYRMGYGLVNIKKAAELVSADGAHGRHAFIKQVLAKGSAPAIIPVKAIGGGTPLRVTLCWSQPSQPYSTSSGVVEPEGYAPTYCSFCVAHPDNTTITYPWRLQEYPYDVTALATNDQPAGSVNNVQVIDIPNPTAGGIYTIEADALFYESPWGFGINPLSVIISGAQAESPPEFKITTFQRVVAYLNNWTVAWPAVPGEFFRVETSTDLVNWTPAIKASSSQQVGDVSALAGMVSVQVRSESGNTRQFYRVKRVEAWDITPPASQ